MVDMYIDVVPNRNSPPAILLRLSYRHEGKVCKETVANLSKCPDNVIEAVRAALKDDQLASIEDLKQIEVVRSLPHGHVAAALGTLRRLGLDKLIASRRSRRRDLVIAMIIARILEPGSKLALARGLDSETATDSLAQQLGLGDVDVDELYDAMDWLLQRQQRIEKALAQKHLAEGTLVLYDLTSAWMEGRCCPLAQHGHSRDGKKGKLQIVFGLMCEPEGRPVAVQVHEGNTADPATLSEQIHKLRHRFRLKRVVLVGDRGMLTEARIREEIKPVEGLDWISALRGPAIGKLVKQQQLQLSLFDQQDLAEIQSPDYPGERLVACRNPLLAERRRLKRQQLLEATERDLDKIVNAVNRDRRPLRGKDRIGLRVGWVLKRHKMAKHFQTSIEDDQFSYQRVQQQIDEEAALDGFYVVRTSLPQEAISAEGAVRSYKGLTEVEQAFRSLKTVDLHVRPIRHRLPDRVRAHVLLSMLAYYVQWHMRQALAPLLFDDEHPQEAAAAQGSPVAPAERSASARRKAATRRNDQDQPVHSFQSLLKDLATITCNTLKFKNIDGGRFVRTTTPTDVQRRALNLLGVTLTPTEECSQ